VLPNGSATTTTRPTGMSKGATTTRPPADAMAAAASSADVTSQFGSYASSVVRTSSVSLPGSARPAWPRQSLRYRSAWPSASR
jgi:hypothetical protein